MFVGTILFLAIGSLSVESYQYRTEGYIRDTGLVRLRYSWYRQEGQEQFQSRRISLPFT